MLQLIIWLGCLLLILNGLKALQTGAAAEAGSPSRTIGVISAVLAMVGAVAFFAMASNQTDYSSDGYSDLQGLIKYTGTMSPAEQSNAALTPRQREIKEEMGY